jgi:hypothetical protein
VAETLAAGDTEVSVLIPRREYTKLWHRLLHDRSSQAIIAAVGSLPHCNVTVVPYHLGSQPAVEDAVLALAGPATNGRAPARTAAPTRLAKAEGLPDRRTKIADIKPRERISVAGRVRSVRVQPWGGAPTLECLLVDETGAITIVFLGRREIGGIHPGTILSIEGVAGVHRGMQAILNPAFTVISAPAQPSAPGEH